MITINSDADTITLTGEEVAVEFRLNSKQRFWINNSSGSDVYASETSGFVPETAGVYTFFAGEKQEITLSDDAESKVLYFRGNGKIYIRRTTKDDSCPFVSSGKGGGSGGNGKKGVGVYGLPIVTNVLTGDLWEAN